MATVRQYTNVLRSKQAFVGNLLGVDLNGIGSKETRVMNLTLMVMVAAVIKVLVDKGLITEAEMVATLDGTLNDGWPPEPLDPPPAS